MYRDNYKPDQPNYEYMPPYQPYSPLDPMMHSAQGPQKYYQPPINPNLSHNVPLQATEMIGIDPSLNPPPPPYPEQMYESRYYWQEMNPNPNTSEAMKMRMPPQREYPDNIVKKIASLISIHLPQLQKQMSKATLNNRSGYKEVEYRRNRSRSPQDRHRRERSREKHRKTDDRQWVCKKCSFNNFDFRNRCKKCDQFRE